MKFRKKPVVIDAVLWTGTNIGVVSEFMGHRNLNWDKFQGLSINNLEGNLHASEGDWIICGVRGEFYPCKPDIFENTYERVD